MLKIFSTPITTISFFRSFRFMSLVFFSFLVVISCGDTTDASDDEDVFSGPTSKAELLENINPIIATNPTANLNHIDTSRVPDMSELFKDNTQFNGDISSWNMRGVTSVNSMFEGATNFNQDLSGWVLKAGVIAKASNKPTKMFYKSGMRPKMLPKMNFYQYAPTEKVDLQLAIAAEIDPAAQGDEADLSIIDTSQITDLSLIFLDKSTFNGYVATWDISKVEDMNGTFNGATAFDQPVGNWDTSSATNMRYVFFEASSFNQPIGNWNTSNAWDMDYMFHKAYAFNQPIGDWDTSKVREFFGMFSLATSFNQDIKRWNGDSVTDKGFMFQGVTVMQEANKAPWMPVNN